MADRFIKLYDKIMQWEWYKDVNTFRLFIHLLLRANYKDLRFEGKTIQRGQLVTSLASLASETGLTQRQIRVSLDRLKMTGEVSSLSCPRYRIITIVKYNEYQSDGRQNVSLMTDKMSASRQPHDSLVTGSRQAHDKLMTTSIEQIEEIEQIDKVEQIEERGGRTAKRFYPPTREEIEIFCLENGLTIDIDRFINYYSSNGWMVGRNKMKDWQATVRNWAKRDNDSGRPVKPAPTKRVIAQEFPQRDYSSVNDDMMSSLAAEMEQARRDGII